MSVSLRAKSKLLIIGGVALFLCLLSSPAYAGSAIIRGTVINATTKLPISGCSINVYIPTKGFRASCQTNPNGTYQLPISASSSPITVVVNALKSGYSQQVKTLSVRQGATYTLNFSLNQLDTIPPRGLVRINGGAQNSGTTSVILNLTAQDERGGSGINQMRFSNDNLSWSAPELFAVVKSWQLTPEDGPKKVYAKFSDKAGNWSAPCSDSITLNAAAPKINNISPADAGRFFEYDPIALSVTLDDPLFAGLEYQYSIDGVVKQPWSTHNSYIWATTSANVGLHKMKAEVRNGKGYDAIESEVYLFRRPIAPPE